VIIDTEFNSAAQVPSRECVEGAVLAEAKGFGCVWKGESNSRDPLVLLSAMAAKTERVRLGTAIYHMFGRSPVTMAYQAATLNELSANRLILGLGVANPTLAAWHGAAYERPLRQIREYIEVIRATYAGGRVDYDGDFYSVKNFKLAFDPPAGDLRIWLAALGPQMTRLAGRISDGIIINMANPAMIRQIVDNFQAAADDAGREPGRLDVVSKIRVSIDADIEQARGALKKVCTFYTLAFGYSDMLRKMGWGGVVDSARSAYEEGGFHAARLQIPDEMLDDVPMVAATNTDAVRRRLALHEQAGSTRCIVAYVPARDDDTWTQIKSFVDRADFTGHPAAA
jgi:probable F420-dependent oxidoreductase